MSTSSSREGGQPKHVRNKQAQDPVAAMDLVAVLKKFDVSEQVDIRRHYKLMPNVVMSLWRENYQLLDFREFQQHLLGEPLHTFLHKMRRHFTSVRFTSEQLQDELNILDHSGITELTAVRDCEITWDTKDNSTSTSTSQWPLHALPKLLCSLSHLTVHMPVQVGFIEHFSQLKSLKLHDDVSREALAAIWKSCKALERVELLGRGTPNTIGISQCVKLTALTLPVSSFNASSAFEILQTTNLRFLELQKQDELATPINGAIFLVVQQRSYDIDKIYINGKRLGSHFMSVVNLHSCTSLTSLSLVDCLFGELEVNKMGTIPLLNNLTFNQCCDLSNVQLLDFVKASPQLAKLNLLSCSLLTDTFLYTLCEWRCMGKPFVPTLALYLEDCANLKEELNKHVSNRQICTWVLRQLIAYSYSLSCSPHWSWCTCPQKTPGYRTYSSTSTISNNKCQTLQRY